MIICETIDCHEKAHRKFKGMYLCKTHIADLQLKIFTISHTLNDNNRGYITGEYFFFVLANELHRDDSWYCRLCKIKAQLIEDDGHGYGDFLRCPRCHRQEYYSGDPRDYE